MSSPIDVQERDVQGFDEGTDLLLKPDDIEETHKQLDERRQSIEITKPLQSIVELNYEASSDEDTLLDKDRRV